jgi:hypothetical protein
MDHFLLPTIVLRDNQGKCKVAKQQLPQKWLYFCYSSCEEDNDKSNFDTK